MKELIIQLIGAVAFVLLGGSYYRKEKLQILFMQIFASLTFAIHYYLLSRNNRCNM